MPPTVHRCAQTADAQKMHILAVIDFSVVADELLECHLVLDLRIVQVRIKHDQRESENLSKTIILSLSPDAESLPSPVVHLIFTGSKIYLKLRVCRPDLSE